MSPRADRPITVTRSVYRRRRRVKAIAAISVVAVAVGATGYGAWQFIEENEYLLDERCEVTVNEAQHRLTPAQTYSAAQLATGAADRDMPIQAAIDALAMSLQETGLENRADPEEVAEAEAAAEEAAAEGESEDAEDAEAAEAAEIAPVLFASGGPQWDAVDASNTTPTTRDDFYDRLVESSNGEGESDVEWSPELGLDEASTALGRPHNATFYPQHEELARAFARPLTGVAPLGMTCHLSQIDVPGPDAEGLGEELNASLPRMLGEEAVTVSGSGESASVSVAVGDIDAEAGVHDPVNGDGSDASEGTDPLWMVAQWAVASAETYGVQSVHAGTHEWSRDTGLWERVDEVSDESVEIGFSRD